MTRDQAERYQYALEELTKSVDWMCYIAPPETRPKFEALHDYLLRESHNAYRFAMRWWAGVQEQNGDYPYDEHCENIAVEIARMKGAIPD